MGKSGTHASQDAHDGRLKGITRSQADFEGKLLWGQPLSVRRCPRFFQADPDSDPALKKDTSEIEREVRVQLSALHPLPLLVLEAFLPPLHEALEGRNTSETHQPSCPESKPNHGSPREEHLHQPWPPVTLRVCEWRHQSQGQDPPRVSRRHRRGYGSAWARGWQGQPRDRRDAQVARPADHIREQIYSPAMRRGHLLRSDPTLPSGGKPEGHSFPSRAARRAIPRRTEIT